LVIIAPLISGAPSNRRHRAVLQSCKSLGDEPGAGPTRSADWQTAASSRQRNRDPFGAGCDCSSRACENRLAVIDQCFLKRLKPGGGAQTFALIDAVSNSAEGEAEYTKADGDTRDFLTLATKPNSGSTPNRYVGLGYWQRNFVSSGWLPLLIVWAVMADPAASYWLKQALASALDRDVFDAERDALVLAGLLTKRLDALVERHFARTRR
jgi:hypothetical protein